MNGTYAERKLKENGPLDMFKHTRSIGVFLWGKHVGDVIPSRTHRGTYAFIYDLGFINGGVEIAPLEMPLADRVYDMTMVGNRFGVGNARAIIAELRDTLKKGA